MYRILFPLFSVESNTQKCIEFIKINFILQDRNSLHFCKFIIENLAAVSRV